MEILITILYVAVCLFLILVVLLQSGKAGDLASTFGGASSQTAFGSRGTANVLSRATTACAFLFLAFALTLAVLSSTTTRSVLDDVAEEPAAVEETTGADEASAPAAEEESPAVEETPAETTPPAQE